MSNIIETISGIADYAKSKNIAHLHTEGTTIENNIIQINGRYLVNFASCSYLGLEFHEEMKRAAIEAVTNFGTQFSSSRAYLSLGIYSELTSNLNKIFGGHTVVTPTTTLGHISAIPVITTSKDLIILDHQVHNSVQMAVQMCKAKGTDIKIIRHNNMAALETILIEDRNKYDRIWYMADGIYSMYGDKAPIHELKDLLDKYANFHLYIDDAHAMSCYGERGQGFVLSEVDITEKMIVGTSLNKAFASGGGAIICGKKEWAELIQKCGGPMITSGPMQPSCLGAANAAAKLHLNGKIKPYQSRLTDNIRYMTMLLERHNLPDLSEKDSPIFFVGTSVPAVAYNIIEKMVDLGHYLNLGIFPAVPIKNTGVRFTITALHTFEQLEAMVIDLHKNFHNALVEENFSLEKIYKAFKIAPPEEKFFREKAAPIFSNAGLTSEIHEQLSGQLLLDWNQSVGNYSTLTGNNLMELQKIHSKSTSPENNWEMKYLFIRNEKREVVLATFFTACIVKEDMLSNAELSVQIEKLREKDPLYLTTKMVMIGCPLSEGNQIFLNKKTNDKKSAFKLLISALEKFKDQSRSQSIMIRDMIADDAEFDYFMVDQGYFKIDLPESYSLETTDFEIENFKASLSSRNRRHFKENVQNYADRVIFNTISHEGNTKDWENLYTNVYSRNKEINTFKIKSSFFEFVSNSDAWEVLEVRSKKENNLLGMAICCKGTNSYNPVIVGLNYELNKDYSTYRNLIWSVIKRAKELHLKTINFGYSAGTEKRKFGASKKNVCAYMQCEDNFNQELLLNEKINNRELTYAH
jgi:7-keto-8-aminopelargonate synthetase-like enzyme